jgi:hypothetical protein
MQPDRPVGHPKATERDFQLMFVGAKIGHVHNVQRAFAVDRCSRFHCGWQMSKIVFLGITNAI